MNDVNLVSGISAYLLFSPFSRDNVFADQRARRRQLRNNMGGRSMFFEDRHKIPVVKVSRRPSQKTFVYRRGSEAITEGTLYSNTSADPKRITMDSPEGAINPVFAETAVGAMYHQHKVYYNTPAAKSDSDSDDSLNPYD